MTMMRYSNAAKPTSSAIVKLRNESTQSMKKLARKSSTAILSGDGTKTHVDAFKQWPKAMVESNGDYRAEAHLEQHIGGPLYSRQHDLPRLPIPSLQETMTIFLPTALPLAESEEEKKSLVEACEVFPTQAEQLQRRLEDRRDGEMKDSSWLSLWWNTLGYLQVRDPVVINVSYFFHFADDGTLPMNSTKSLGVMRGASILVAAAEFRKKVCTGTLPCETIGRKEPKTPLCSVAFKYMFNSCRVPRREQDTYRMYDPSLHTHCVVACRGQFFAVDFIDKETGDPLPLHVLEDRLQKCVELAQDPTKPDVPTLGWLTSSDRDSWADARDELLRAGGEKMERALSTLESGALLLCLDDEVPVSRDQCGELFLHGGVTSGHNRWFDKSIQLICANNGKAGFLGEHSMMDGMPLIGLADHITKTTYGAAKDRSYGASSVNDVDAVKNIFEDCAFDLNSAHSTVDLHVRKAKDAFTRLVTNNHLHVQSFQGYGSTYIKQAGYSPDAYVQMAIQLATYRLFGNQAGTYEATQMRPFLHGRTETTRGVSPASAAFVQKMGLRPKYDEADVTARKEKLSLLSEAVSSHVRYMGNAAKGMGVDRHLLGLSMCVQEGEEAPDLYSHPLFVRSKRWRVSTSHLTHPKFENWGFGQVVPDGVGVAYAVKADCCIFNVTALKERDWTDRLSHHLEEALLEMRVLNDMDKPMVSKL